MWKKLLILSLFIALLLFISAPNSPVNAGGKTMKINWRVAGTIVQSIPINSPATGSLIGDHSLINLSAKGSPGPANLTLLSTTTDVNLCVSDCFVCADDYDTLEVYFEKDDMVAVFPDQSLLFASIDTDKYGILCFSSIYTTYFKVKMNVTGGTGRFQGATGGELIGEGYGYPANIDSTLAGENGTITGTIYLP